MEYEIYKTLELIAPITCFGTNNLIKVNNHLLKIESIEISNYGNVKINGIVHNRLTLPMNDVIKKINFFVATLFIDNPKNFYKVKHIDGNIHNLYFENLQWVGSSPPLTHYSYDGKLVSLDEFKNVLIDEYVNTNVKKKELLTKFLIKQEVLYPILKGYKKKFKTIKFYDCKICHTNNKEDFNPSKHTICRICNNEIYKTRYRELDNDGKIIYRKKTVKWIGNNLIRARVGAAKCRAKNRNLQFNLTDDFIKKLFDKQKGLCKYSGMPIFYMLDDKDVNYEIIKNSLISIDRVDSAKGYTEDNVVLCSVSINHIKNYYNIDEFKTMVKMIYEHNNLRDYEIKNNFFISKKNWVNRIGVETQKI